MPAKTTTMPDLTTPDGEAVPLDSSRDQIEQEFARAMSADEPGGATAPPLREDKPAGEKPKGRRGRPPKAEQPRTETKPPVSQKSDKDFTDEVVGLTTLGWAALAATPYTSPYACVIEANQEQLCAALNAGAQNNAAIRAKIEAWSAGGGGVWMLQLGAVATNMTVQAVQLLKDPVLRSEARAHTEGKFRKFLRDQGVKLPGDEPAEADDAAAAA
jgi:hypothetical protein